MKHIFYFLSIFIIYYEYLKLRNPQGALTLKRSIEYLLKNKISVKDWPLTLSGVDWPLTLSSIVLFDLFYLLYTLIGLCTSQWVLFVIIWFMGLIPKKKPLIICIDSLLTICILIFILLNVYYLNIDIDIIQFIFNIIQTSKN